MISKSKLKKQINQSLIELHEFKTRLNLNNLEFDVEVYDIGLTYEIIVNVEEYNIKKYFELDKDENTSADNIINKINLAIVEISKDFLGESVEDENEDEIDLFFKNK